MAIGRVEGSSPRPVVHYALLALLLRRPDTGLQLAKRMRDPVGLFWSAPHSQIYPALARLTADGLVAVTPDSAGTVRPHKRYHITSAGSRALSSWLTSDLPHVPPRDELVLRAYAAGVSDHGRLATVFRTEADRLRAEISELEAFAAEVCADLGGDPVGRRHEAEFGNWATIQAGLLSYRSRLQWCEWMIAVLTGEPSPQQPGAGPG